MNNTDTPLTDREPKHWISGSDGMMAVRVEFAQELERRLAASCEDARSNGMGCLLITHYEHRLRVATALLTRARNNVSLPHELYDDIQHFLNAP